jgi:deoxyadenosine/deoxycytidine kinase
LLWNPEWWTIPTYVALVITLRFSFLYFYVVYAFARWAFGAVFRSLYQIYYFAFRFMPTNASTAERMAETHALVGRLVLLEGNIAVGKTTIVNALARCPIGEIVNEGIPQDMLADFNRTKDGNAFQLRLGAKRIADITRCAAQLSMTSKHTAALVSEVKSQRFIIDRSVIGCRAFALYNYVTGGLSAATLGTYMIISAAELKRFFDDQLHQVPVVVFYLPVPARVSKERLMKRTGPDQDTSLQYLLGVSLMHALVLIHLLRATPRSVRVLLYDSTSMLGADPPGACVCQRLKSASTVAEAALRTTLPNTEPFDGRLDLNLAERDRLAQVVRDYLFMPPDLVDCVNERKWIETLFAEIARQPK